MADLLAAYQGVLVLSGAVSALAAGIAWRNRDARGATPLAVVLAASSVWAWSELGGTLWRGTAAAVFWHKVVLSAVVVLTPAMFVFALQYTGRGERVTRRLLALLAIEPVVFGALVWTTGTHRLVVRAVEVDPTAANGLRLINGAAYTGHRAYSYLLLGTAVALVAVFAMRSRYLYQRQAALIVTGAVVPWLGDVVTHAAALRYSPTPISFVVTGLAFTWAVVYEDFLDITPIATDTVLDEIDTAVFVVDEAGRIVDLNGPAGDLVDRSEGDAVGGDARSLLGEVFDEASVYDDLAAARESTTTEVDAGERFFRVQVSPLVERGEELVGRVFLVVDLTDQRIRERELERQNERLDRFASVVSHDLRNPLGVARSSVEFARETGEDEHFERALRAHDRMERLVEDLLTLARQDRRDLDLAPVELGRAARQAWTYVDTGDATLSVAVDERIVRADADRLSQLFENLFRNAVEHGGEAVSVTVEPLADGPGFAVVDDGPGFETVDPGAVFDDGFTTGGGTGLGLSIVAEIAAQHGWTVTAEDDPDRGARFEVVTGEDEP